jgi:hypothetical protein
MQMPESATTNYEIVRQAILKRRSLACVYDAYARFFSPHILGESFDGYITVVGFQYAGRRPEGPLPHDGDWCCFRLERLVWLRPAADRWTTGSLLACPVGRISVVDASAICPTISLGITG